MIMPINRCRTVPEAREFAKFKVLVRSEFPDKFVRFEEGDKVQTLDGEVGRVTSYGYFPDTDSYVIEVCIGSLLKTFTDPESLEKIEESGCLTN